jgi:hypothetical protein
MKINKLILLLTFISSIFSVQNLHAQWTDMVWEENNLKFVVPTEFDVKQNDESTFTASGSIFTMTINAWDNDNVLETSNDLCDKALSDLDCTGRKLIRKWRIENKEGLIGYQMHYTAYQNDSLMHIVIGGFKSNDLLKNYSVVILYWDDSEQNQINYDAAIYILDSLELIDE